MRDPRTAAIQEIWAARQGAPTRGDTAYVLYLVVMVILVVLVPLGRTAGLLLVRPDVLPVLAHPLAGAWASAASWWAAAGLVLLGGLRGPAVLSTFFTRTLASNDQPRRRALRRPFGRSALAVLALALGGAAVVAWVLHLGAGRTGSEALALLLSSAGTALLLTGAWLLGQLVGPAARRAAAALLVAAGAVIAALGAAPPGPWAWAVLGGGIIVVGLGARALDRLRGEVLLEQAGRWESAMTVATSGDLAGAAGTYRARPTAGRRLRAVVGSGASALGLLGLYARRDGIAWLRTPERLLGAVAGGIGAGVAIVLALQLTGPLRWILLLVGVVVLWAAAGGLIDGLRHGIETLGAPRLLAQGILAQCAMHAVAPLLALVALTALGAGAGLGLAGAIEAGSWSPGTAAAPGVAVLQPGADGLLRTLLMLVLLSAAVLLARIWAAAKGPMPLSLATPMPTPMGDISIGPMLAWQAGEPLAVLAVAAALALAVLHGTLMTIGLVGAVAAVVLGLLARERIRELAGESVRSK